jgi:hypothetical protein
MPTFALRSNVPKTSFIAYVVLFITGVHRSLYLPVVGDVLHKTRAVTPLYTL